MPQKKSRNPFIGSEILPVASHARPTTMDAMRKASGIGPQIRAPKDTLKSASSIGPLTGESRFVQDKGMAGPRNLQDFIGRIGDLASQVLPTDLSSVDKVPGLGGVDEAVTRFLSPSGVPDKAMREAFTKQFLHDTKQTHPSVGRAGEYFAKKYPRIAAHTEVKPKLTNDPDAYATTNPNSGDRRIPVEFSQIGVNRPDSDVLETLAHEGTHVAQNIGNTDANVLYDAAHKLVGYSQNPYEVAGRRSGGRVRWQKELDNIEQNAKDANDTVVLEDIKRARKIPSPYGQTPGKSYKVKDRLLEIANNIERESKENPEIMKLIGGLPPEAQARALSPIRDIKDTFERRKLGPWGIGDVVSFETGRGEIHDMKLVSKDQVDALKALARAGAFKIKGINNPKTAVKTMDKHGFFDINTKSAK